MGKQTWEPQPHPEGCQDQGRHEHGIATYTCDCGGYGMRYESQRVTSLWRIDGESYPASSMGRVLEEHLDTENTNQCPECQRLRAEQRER
jgi:hypothetical protein